MAKLFSLRGYGHTVAAKNKSEQPLPMNAPATQATVNTANLGHQPLDAVRVEAEKVKPLRIALLGYRSHPHVGGQGIYLKYLSRALCELGHTVDVISGPPYPELDPRVRLIKLPSLDLYSVMPKHISALRWQHFRSWSDIFEWWSMATGGFAEPYTFGRRLVRYLSTRQQDYDLIHDNQSLCYGLLTLQKKGWPVIATVHHPITRDRQLALAACNDWGQRLLIRRWYSFVKMQSRVVQQLQHVITVSQSSRNDIAREFQRAVEHTSVIANGIDTELFSPKPKVTAQPGRIITTTSSDQALKGFSVLLKAFEQIRQTITDAHLVVIGKLQKDGTNQALLEQLRLQDYVQFKSELTDEELVNEYALSQVAVCPSLYEGFGLPAAEAMSCGVPLVSSDGGALAEVVGEGGLLVTAGDHQALASAVVSIMQTPQLESQLKQRGRQRILQYFCWRRVASELTLYYQNALLATQSPESINANH